MPHLHSVPARVQAEPCETVARRPHPRLRPYVVGYAGFRSPDGAATAHRVLPVNLVTMIIDRDAGGRVVTGPRTAPAVFDRTRWGQGVSIGLTPLGASALLSVHMRELAGIAVPLPDLLGGGADHLAERLDAAPDWSTRFALLDNLLAARLAGTEVADDLVQRAWWRLQEPALCPPVADQPRVMDHPRVAVHPRIPARPRVADHPRVGAVAAELGVSRRYLEVRFRRQVGLSPATVARVARFQRAVWMLAEGNDLPRTAVESGYADQPHFTREVRTMAGLTPTQLCAFLQYRQLAAH